MSSVQNNTMLKEVMAAGGKPAVFHNLTENAKLQLDQQGSAAAAAAALKAAAAHATFYDAHPSATVHHHHSAMKEPMSPAISVVSTHCGGSPMVSSTLERRGSLTDRSLSGMSSLDLSGTSAMTLTSSGGAHHHFEEVSEGSDSEHPFPQNRKNANKPVALFKAPVHCPKMKGEAQPVGFRKDAHQMHTVCEKTQKIIDEAHHFGLCDHYAKLLDQAKEVGFKNINWPTNFTMFHLAAKKNNKEFIEWLVRNDFDDLHTIDDFGKKPIDYACPKKRDSVHAMLHAMMMCIKPANTPQEQKYQAIKAGTYVDPEKAQKKESKKMSMAEILQSPDIALGDVPGANKPSDMMTAYEAETIVPVEYKKCFKMMSQGGWQAMEGKWPHQGTTVLHWAARNGKEELCHFLVVEYNADAKEEDGSGHDAIYHAKLKRHRKLAKKLLLKFKEPKMSKGKKK